VKATRRLAVFCGVVFVLDGLAEAYRVLFVGGGGLAWWVLTLCGGGALILAAERVLDRHWLSFTMTAIGCLAVVIPTLWTVVLPILAVLLIALALVRAGEASDRAAAAGAGH
jgi:hypothetical protein